MKKKKKKNATQDATQRERAEKPKHPRKPGTPNLRPPEREKPDPQNPTNTTNVQGIYKRKSKRRSVRNEREEKTNPAKTPSTQRPESIGTPLTTRSSASACVPFLALYLFTAPLSLSCTVSSFSNQPKTEITENPIQRTKKKSDENDAEDLSGGRQKGKQNTPILANPRKPTGAKPRHSYLAQTAPHHVCDGWRSPPRTFCKAVR
jgi:hypothetical protein